MGIDGFCQPFTTFCQKKPVFKEEGNTCHYLDFKDRGILVQSIIINKLEYFFEFHNGGEQIPVGIFSVLLLGLVNRIEGKDFAKRTLRLRMTKIEGQCAFSIRKG